MGVDGDDVVGDGSAPESAHEVMATSSSAAVAKCVIPRNCVIC